MYEIVCLIGCTTGLWDTVCMCICMCMCSFVSKCVCVVCFSVRAFVLVSVYDCDPRVKLKKRMLRKLRQRKGASVSISFETESTLILKGPKKRSFVTEQKQFFINTNNKFEQISSTVNFLHYLS